MKLLGLGKTGKPATSAPAPIPWAPDRSAKARLRVTVGTSPSPDDDVICEVPTQVIIVRQPEAAEDRIEVVIVAADLSFLPAPLDTTAEHALIWPTPAGQMEMPVLVPAVDGARWTLLVTGPPRRVQRRQFVRVDVKLPATLALLGGEEPQRWDGTIVDLGEGGVRCVVQTEPPAAGSRIVVTFSADDTVLECAGVVIRHLPVGDESEATALGVRFDDPEEHGDAIRRVVFAEQLRIRQLRAEADTL